MTDDDDRQEFELYVSAIIPPRNREPGRVRFTFEVEGLESLEIDLPYDDAETIDAGVKQAARTLVIVAEALAAEAKRLAE